jgi:hypothetical protein
MTDKKKSASKVDVDPLMPVDVVRSPSQREHSDGTTMVRPSEPPEIGEMAVEEGHRRVASLNLVGNVEPIDEEE